MFKISYKISKLRENSTSRILNSAVFGEVKYYLIRGKGRLTMPYSDQFYDSVEIFLNITHFSHLLRLGPPGREA